MNNSQLQAVRKIANAMDSGGDYQIIITKKEASGKIHRLVKACFLPYDKAVEWNEYYKNSHVEKMR